MTQTALDEFIAAVRFRVSIAPGRPLDESVWLMSRAGDKNAPENFANALQDPRFQDHCERHMLETGWTFDGWTWRHPDGRAYQGSLPMLKSNPAFDKNQEWFEDPEHGYPISSRPAVIKELARRKEQDRQEAYMREIREGFKIGDRVVIKGQKRVWQWFLTWPWLRHVDIPTVERWVVTDKSHG